MMDRLRTGLLALMACGWLLGAGVMAPENWHPNNGGHVGALPKMEAVQSPYGAGIQVTVLEANPYQGMNVWLPEPVEMGGIGTITFRVKQTAVRRFPTHGCLHLYYSRDRRKGLFITFLITAPEADGWSRVVIPVDLRTIGSLDRQGSPYLGKALGGNFCLFAALREPGQTMAIADLKFNPKQTGVAKIPVIHYEYRTRRTSGDRGGKALTDGRVEEADQAFYQQYTDDPEIVFDLGGFYLVERIDLSAVAAPGQNFYECQVATSSDGKEWKPAASIPAREDGGAKKAYTVSGAGLSATGRYFKLRLGRSRSDFHVRLAEVAFFGKIPTEAELADVARRSYNVGPALSGQHWDYAADGASLSIDKKNGVAFAYRRGGELLAERVFGRYELSDGLRAAKADDYAATVLSAAPSPEGFTVQYTLPALKDIVFRRTYRLADGMLAVRLEWESRRKDRRVLFTATEVVLPQDLREGGVYETWGAGHDMQHKFASEVPFRFPADTGPVVVFESPKRARAMLHFRYRHDGRHVQIGSGTVTVAGVGDKRTAFTPVGWELGDGVFQLTEPGARSSVETRLIACQGDLTDAFDRYLKLPEVLAFRRRIRRPAWLKDIRFQTGGGWEGMWGDAAVREARYYASFIREGDFVFGMNDSDFIWGDFPSTGTVVNQFGGEQTIEDVRRRQDAIREASGGHARLYQYTWLWSVSDRSRVFREHPEWFITRNAKGEAISFFPGWGVNYYRHLKEPASRRHVVDSITAFVRAFGTDLWYLDGGGSPVSIHWPRMTVDEPDAYDQAYLDIRENLQRRNPDTAVFFNHPENPLGDFGFLENAGGILTSNWRDGATWMYKFKLWQRPEPLVMPTYIYWTPGVDAAMRQYIVGTGLAFSTGRTHADPRRDIPYISAVQQSRWARLVNARLSPNWRHAPREQLEGMPLTFGPDGWVFLLNHDKAPLTRQVAVDAAPLGLQEGAPLYQWQYALRDFAELTEMQTEADREKGYRASGWQSGFVVAAAFLGRTAFQPRLQREIQLAPGQLKLWYVTQSPALVWSVDGLRVQLPLSRTMGVEASGRESAEGLRLHAQSERREAELAAPLPQGRTAAAVTVNGARVPFDTLVLNGTRMVKFAVPQGASAIQVDFGSAKAADGAYSVSAAPGKGTLKLRFQGADAPATAVVTRGTELVWSRAVALSNGRAEVEIALPASVAGGAYAVALYDQTGRKLAEAGFKLRSGTPGVGPLRAIADHPSTHSRKALAPLVKARGVTLHAQAERHHPQAGEVRFDPATAAVEIRMAKMVPSQFNDMAGAYEMTARRYLQIRLTGNYAQMGQDGPFAGPRNFTQRYGDAESMAALQFDFEGAGGYAVRAFAGLGLLNLPIRTKSPVEWGAARPPQHLFTVSNIVSGVSGKDEEVLWLDLASLGAPSDWTGKLWFGLRFTQANPNRHLKVEVLQSADVLPPGAKAVEPYVLQGGVTPPPAPEKHTLPQASASVRLDGRLDEADWGKALDFDGFSLLGNPLVKAPPSRVRLMRDAKNLYVAVVFDEPRPEGFLGTKDICWYNDGVEIYFQKRSSPKAMLHFIVDVGGHYYAQDNSDFSRNDAPKRDLPRPAFAANIDRGKWTLELAVPIQLLGDGAKATGFNFGRNRQLDGLTQTFSLAPGNAYRNFNAHLILWP